MRVEEKLSVFHEFSQRHDEKLQMVVVYVRQPSEELLVFWKSFKGLTWARDPNLTVFERINVLYMPRFYTRSFKQVYMYEDDLGNSANGEAISTPEGSYGYVVQLLFFSCLWCTPNFRIAVLARYNGAVEVTPAGFYTDLHALFEGAEGDN